MTGARFFGSRVTSSGSTSWRRERRRYEAFVGVRRDAISSPGCTAPRTEILTKALLPTGSPQWIEYYCIPGLRISGITTRPLQWPSAYAPCSLWTNCNPGDVSEIRFGAASPHCLNADLRTVSFIFFVNNFFWHTYVCQKEFSKYCIIPRGCNSLKKVSYFTTVHSSQKYNSILLVTMLIRKDQNVYTQHPRMGFRCLLLQRRFLMPSPSVAGPPMHTVSDWEQQITIYGKPYQVCFLWPWRLEFCQRQGDTVLCAGDAVRHCCDYSRASYSQLNRCRYIKRALTAYSICTLYKMLDSHTYF